MKDLVGVWDEISFLSGKPCYKIEAAGTAKGHSRQKDSRPTQQGETSEEEARKKDIGSDIITILDIFTKPQDSYEQAKAAVYETSRRLQVQQLLRLQNS